MKSKILVIGLDGACWDLIDEWIENGELPNIKKLRDEGGWGPLESCIPPITCPAWQCYATGKNPGKLGVFWWQHLDMTNRQVITPNSSSFRSRALWDYLNDAGYKTGIIGMPTTYPPKKVDGFMVCGGPDCGASGYTHPPELESWLKQEFDYEVHPQITVTEQSKGDSAIDEVLKLISTNFEVARALMEKSPVDFLQVTSFHINGPLQHYFYNGAATRRAWKLIDTKIGELAPRFEYILIMSDHGTSPMLKNFFINAWLEREGYLVRHQTFYDFLFKLGLNQNRISKFLSKLHLSDFVHRFSLAQRIARQIPDSKGQLSDQAGQGTLSRVDWEKTKVIGSPQGPVYINRCVVNDGYEKLRSELTDKLEGLKDPETGKNVIQKVYKREELYHGSHTEQAPDLVALDADEYHNRGGIGKPDILEKSEWQGNNAQFGLFLLNGPGIRQNKRLDGMTIFDLAPTLLHLMGTKIPTDMDGRVVRELFEPQLQLAKREPVYQKITKEAETEKEKIKRASKKLHGRGF